MHFCKQCKETLVVVDGVYQEYASFKDEKKKLLQRFNSKFPNAIYLELFQKLMLLEEWELIWYCSTWNY